MKREDGANETKPDDWDFSNSFAARKGNSPLSCRKV